MLTAPKEKAFDSLPLLHKHPPGAGSLNYRELGALGAQIQCSREVP